MVIRLIIRLSFGGNGVVSVVMVIKVTRKRVASVRGRLFKRG